FGLPRMGGAGAGLSTSISISFMAVVLALSGRASSTKSGPIVKPVLSGIAAILELGWAIRLPLFRQVGIFTFTSAMIGRLGEEQLAGHQVALTIASLSYMCAVGIANATTARVGFHVGRGDSAMARRVGFLGIGAGALFMGCCGASYAI